LLLRTKTTVESRPQLKGMEQSKKSEARLRQEREGQASFFFFVIAIVAVLIGIVLLIRYFGFGTGYVSCEDLKAEAQAAIATTSSVDKKVEILKDFDKKAKAKGCY
jgi:hypothetical protein